MTTVAKTQRHLPVVPFQIVVLTHELADMASGASISRLVDDFYPTQPVVLYGRATSLGSQV